MGSEKELSTKDTIHPYVQLALDALREYLTTGKVIKPPLKKYPALKNEAGLFVSFKQGDQLKGCIGTLASTTDNIGTEIIQNAINSATCDSRFSPILPDELDDVTCTIDVLGEPDLVRNVEDLDPKIYGIIVKRNEKTSLLLPDLDGVETIEDQINIAKNKAGVGIDEYVEIYKFKTERYK